MCRSIPTPYTYLQRLRCSQLRQERLVYSNAHPGCSAKLQRSGMNGILHPTALPWWGRHHDPMPLRWNLADAVASVAINMTLQKMRIRSRGCMGITLTGLVIFIIAFDI